ncbi:MAG: hypothetical protein LBJ11_09185 [Oscillospiraceae bacterium]|jgi:hypothetical protein|nr:hypothetical protein [Oscillospiraceae bacterium]
MKTREYRAPPPALPLLKDVYFNSGDPVPVSPQGEHNAVILVFHLTPKFEGVSAGLITCQQGAVTVYQGLFDTDKAAPVYIEGGKVFLTLWRELTTSTVLQVQITGITPGGATVQTPISPNILFCDSLPGGWLADAPPDLLAQLEQMAAAIALLQNTFHLATDTDIDELFQN